MCPTVLKQPWVGRGKAVREGAGEAGREGAGEAGRDRAGVGGAGRGLGKQAGVPSQGARTLRAVGNLQRI